MAAFESVEGGTGGFLVAQVLTYASEEAEARSALADEKIDETMALLTTTPLVTRSLALDDLAVPALNLPSLGDPLNADEERARFVQMVQDTAQEIAAGFTSYLNTYFPLGDELAHASAWVRNAIVNGGSGINPTVEAQLWQRDRDRILAENARAEEEVTAAWAARRYPMPPGAAVYAVLQLGRDASDKIAQSSRDAAIKSFETEIENVRFAIGKAIELREAAIRTALQYITALVLEPRKMAIELTIGLAELEVKVMQLTTEFYKAQLAAAEVPLRIASAKDEMGLKKEVSNLQSKLDVLLRGRVETTLSGAKMQATQAAALLNGIHGQAGFNTSESL
jgi:hypothetical protein